MQEITEQIDKLISEYARLKNDDVEGLIVRAWVVSYEFTSVELERDQRFGTGTVTPPGQGGTTTVGLFALPAREYGNGEVVDV